MTRPEQWQLEARGLMRHERWSLTGPDRPIKVVPIPAHASASGTLPVSGYFTVAHSLFNKSPLQVQTALGLKADTLKHGMRILGFLRLPQISEYSYELTAYYPDGLAETFMSNPEYPAGDKGIHQWKLNSGKIIQAAVLADLKPGQQYAPYWK